MTLRTCITPEGTFRLGIHRPSYTVANLRTEDHLEALGQTKTGEKVDNRRNFPDEDIQVDWASVIYEIPNAFPFQGATYVDSSWADAKALDPLSISLPAPEKTSMHRALDSILDAAGSKASSVDKAALFAALPESVLSALAVASTDPEDLRIIAALSCDLLFDDADDPSRAIATGLRYAKDADGRFRPVIHRHDLFEAVVNNPRLPDAYKVAMVLRPGVQGGSEVVGDVRSDPDGRTHVFEYLRRNSYIPWGHFAANMAHDAVRYGIRELDAEDMFGLRHLYYQRTYVRLAEQCGLTTPRRRRLTGEELEKLRIMVLEYIRKAATRGEELAYSATLWGWNFGFDFAPSGYRLHASHQQVHQQYALIPGALPHTQATEGGTFRPFACGDLVADAVERYRADTGQGLFTDYLRAIRANRRTDGRPGEADLVVHEDDQVLLFVPKAQACGFELQLMPIGPVGNVLEADAVCRTALDRAMLKAQRALEGLGARMVTSIEYSRRLDSGDPDQRLLYAFLPKLPYAPGGFSEAQSRCIVGHYPEDFALACRKVLAKDM
ncbi:hypothetical protein [Desulfonatronum sp. SC1]|uniref:hypothetical protein n=1 Tax=Desulfonatronum sp. SC1 TaxID=2109626 RepID=UPI000D306317|nr:hypothetical protein [Desulfonatronum sp. SC1]PTN38691.1 hypothetical protein C6366_01775 [Desulfonatronum sp. SC1]